MVKVQLPSFCFTKKKIEKDIYALTDASAQTLTMSSTNTTTTTGSITSSHRTMSIETKQIENTQNNTGTTTTLKSKSFRSLGLSSPALERQPNTIALKGLTNIGNTCFMNSALQCLVGTPFLTEFFLSGRYKSEINTTSVMGQKGELAKAYADLISKFFSDDESDVVNPSVFRSTLCRFANQFSNHRQHDSQELLIFLLDGLHEDLNRCTTKPYVEDVEHDGSRSDEEVATEAWANYLLRDKSVIVDLFQGQLKNTLTCLTCSRIAVRFDPFMYLSLPIPRNNLSVSLSDCIKLFSQKEKLEKDNQWYCPNCKTHRDATKQIQIWKLPQVLLIHFKRFEHNKFGRLSKRSDLVKFPLSNLSIDEFGSNEIKDNKKHTVSYNCFAVSNHMGGIDSGHYTAYVNYGSQWRLFDDSRVYLADENQICSKNAYVVMYTKPTEKVYRQSLASPENWPHSGSFKKLALEKIEKKFGGIFSSRRINGSSSSQLSENQNVGNITEVDVISKSENDEGMEENEVIRTTDASSQNLVEQKMTRSESNEEAEEKLKINNS